MTNYLREDTANPVDDAPVHFWYGTIAEDVADFYTNAYVLLPDLSPDVRFGPCFWPRRDESLLPTRGDRCAVMFDNRGQPWIIAWYPDDPSPFFVPSDGLLVTNNNLQVNGYVQASPFWDADATGSRWKGILFGPSQDVSLYRYTTNLLAVDKQLWVGFGTTPGNAYVAAAASGDGWPRVGMLNNGYLWFGPGTSGPDTNLYRVAAGQLQTDGYLIVGNGLVSGYGTARQVNLSSVIIPGGNAGINFGSAGDTNLYRSFAAVLKTDGGFRAAQSVVANHTAANQIDLDADGHIYFGIAADTNLYRSAANTLKTDGSLVVSGTFSPGGIAASGNISATGTIQSGSHTYVGANLYVGSAIANDTNLYRLSAGNLKTDGAFYAGTSVIATSNLFADYGNTGNRLYFGSAADTSLYRAAAGILYSDGIIDKKASAGLKSAPSGISVAGFGFTNIAMTNAVVSGAVVSNDTYRFQVTRPGLYYVWIQGVWAPGSVDGTVREMFIQLDRTGGRIVDANTAPSSFNQSMHAGSLVVLQLNDTFYSIAYTDGSATTLYRPEMGAMYMGHA